MTKKELAKAISGRPRGTVLTAEENKAAAECGLFVIFGTITNFCKLRGSILKDLPCDKEGYVFFDKGKVAGYTRKKDAEYKKLDALYPKITISRSKGTSGPTWLFETDMPNEPFEILNGNKTVFCTGLVLSKKALNKSYI